MSDTLVIMMAFVPASICVGLAGMLVHQGTKGWGWFLFTGVALAGAAVQILERVA